MSARSDLLAAAQRLTAEGHSPFSPADLIAEARAGGSRYEDSTLRTHVVAFMCMNSPANGPQYNDFYRVGRGLYRLVDREDAPPPSAAPRRRADRQAARAGSAEPERSWPTESAVQAAVVSHLVAEGWAIRRVASTSSREHGVDIKADRAGAALLVEVKGYPLERQLPDGGAIRNPIAATQGRTYFAGALLTGTLLRAEHPDAAVALAFPAVTTYEALAARTVDVLAGVGIAVWLVDAGGAVRTSGIASPSDR